MKRKYLNDAIIGNRKMIASLSSKGELLRLSYPTADYRQFIDYYEMGVKVNDSMLIKLHDDINNTYNQYYSTDTNVLNTEIENTYFKLNMKQEDFVPMKKDVLIRRYTFTNYNKIDLDVKFLINSKLFSNLNNMVGVRICDNAMIQYSHDFAMTTFSNMPIYSYQLNNVEANISSGVINDKDYIAMSNQSAIAYDLGILKPGETKEFNIYIYINKNYKVDVLDDLIKEIDKIKAYDTLKLITDTKNYWRRYVKKHETIKVKYDDELYNAKIQKILRRTILLFPLLVNEETGGIIAALEVDEEKDLCGRYAYCWPRDAVTISQALDMVGMYKDADNFYNIFLRKTQSKNGMWEQRFYTDGRLAPCWGYQIDETASVIAGLYQHFKIKEFRLKERDIDFLKDNLIMCENAMEFLKNYIDNLLNDKGMEENLQTKYSYLDRSHIYKHVSYDLWEMNEGIHLYSLSAIYAAFDAMGKIYAELQKSIKKFKIPKETEKLEEYKEIIKKYILENLYDEKQNILKRNTKDSNMDISIMGAVTPFRVFEPNDKIIQNTVQKINLTLRTYTGGYLRFENDGYIGGKNPWVISTMWMYIYYRLIGAKANSEECLKFVIDTATPLGLLAEQVDNEEMKSKWVIGLGWSHAMFILALGLEELMK
ncbi:MAG: glycoside hydrolase family 15 protein [Clostridia bacterium]|jgi:glycoside hydrolase 15-related protein